MPSTRRVYFASRLISHATAGQGLECSAQSRTAKARQPRAQRRPLPAKGPNHVFERPTPPPVSGGGGSSRTHSPARVPEQAHYKPRLRRRATAVTQRSHCSRAVASYGLHAPPSSCSASAIPLVRARTHAQVLDSDRSGGLDSSELCAAMRKLVRARPHARKPASKNTHSRTRAAPARALTQGPTAHTCAMRKLAHARTQMHAHARAHSMALRARDLGSPYAHAARARARAAKSFLQNRLSECGFART